MTEPAGLAYDQSHRPLWWHSTLDRGASDNFTISLPTNQSPWRLTLLVEPDVGVAGVIRRVLTHYQRMPYNIEGDWMENKK